MVNRMMMHTLFLLFLLSGCLKSLQDDNLSLPLQPYKGTELRTDGYYYERYAIGNGEFRNNVYFLFNNGVMLYGETPSDVELVQLQDEYKSGLFYERAKNVKYHWGLFNIMNNKIEFERWYPGNPPLKSFVRSGIILNDTTFHITSSRRSDGTKQYEEDEYYHFKPFFPKPDSTNPFIK